MIKFLLSIDKVDIHAIKSAIFERICHNHTYNVFLYVLRLLQKIENFDIHMNDDIGFKTACKFNETQIFKHLMSLDDNFDLRANNDYYFRDACKHGQKDIAKYFCTLCSDYVVIIEPFNYIDGLKDYYVKQDVDKFLSELNTEIGTCCICEQEDILLYQLTCNSNHTLCKCCFHNICRVNLKCPFCTNSLVEKVTI